MTETFLLGVMFGLLIGVLVGWTFGTVSENKLWVDAVHGREKIAKDRK